MNTRFPYVIVVIFTLIFSPFPSTRANGSYPDSFVGRMMPEHTFRVFKDSLRQRMRDEADISNIYASGELFLDHLAAHEYPDFTFFAAGDVNQDPVGVIWSQLALAQQGAANTLCVPDDFRKFHLAITLWNAWYSQPNSGLSAELRIRMLFDAYRHLQASCFLVRASGYSPYSKFFHFLFSQIGEQIAVENPSARSFLSDWVQAKLDISRWEWDPELQESLIKVNGLPDSCFPIILNYRSIYSAPQESMQAAAPVLPEWLLADTVVRFQQIGSRIGTALLICDPHGDATPSPRMIELVNQGQSKTIFLQYPFQWPGVADYLVLSAGSLVSPHSESYKVEYHVASEYAAAQGPSGRVLVNRRSVSDLRGLGFRGVKSLSDMTEEERAAFCASWQKEAKQVLAQFHYMLNILSLSRKANPECFMHLWRSGNSETSSNE